MAWAQKDPVKAWDNQTSTWMRDLDENTLLRDLSIPGTHDSAAMKGWTNLKVSQTQQWKIDEQLENGIRFLDLRVKRKVGSSELAMWHGLDYITDYYSTDSRKLLYFRTVIERCVDFLEAHPSETIVISVKDEENSVDRLFLGEPELDDRVYSILTEVNKAHTGPNYRKMWHGHDVDCKLKDVRGRLVLWRRFESKGLPRDDMRPQVDLTGIENNTKGAKAGAYFFVQDYYSEAALKVKMYEWIRTCANAYMTRWGRPDTLKPEDIHDLQVINFLSKAGDKPEYNASVLTPLATRWLKQYLVQPLGPLDGPGAVQPNTNSFRSGIGVIPMDFPSNDLINTIIQLNYQWTFDMMYWKEGGKLWDALASEAGNHEK